MIVFRADCNSYIGSGHVARCACLASELSSLGYDSCLMGPVYLGHPHKDQFKFIEPRPWPRSFEQIINEVNFINSMNPDLLILDDYRLSKDYEGLVKEQDIRWAIFKGPTREPIWADGIINYTPSAKRGDYPGTPDDNSRKFFLGPKYTLLRSEFSTPVMDRGGNDGKLRIFCCFGGGDDRGAVERVLTALSDHSLEVVFDVVVGYNHPNVDTVNSTVASFPGSLVHNSPLQLVKLIDNSDIAIVSGGNIAPEVISRGVPTIIVAIADNQAESGFGWASRGRNCIFLGKLDRLEYSQIEDAFISLRDELFSLRFPPRRLDPELVNGRSALARELVRLIEGH